MLSGRFVVKVQLLHAGVLTALAEMPVAADRPTSVLKEDVAAALGSSTLSDHHACPCVSAFATNLLFVFLSSR